MISISSVLTGMAAGVLLAAPIGPMGMLALLKINDHNRHEAYALGLGTVLADVALALVAVRLGAVSQNLMGWLPWQVRMPLLWLLQPQVLYLLVAVLLVAMAIRFWVKHDHPPEDLVESHDAGALALGFGMTFLHPGIVALYVSVMGGLESGGWLKLETVDSQLTMGAIVGLESLTMWGLLLWGATYLTEHETLQGKGLAVRMRKGLAILLACCGVAAFGHSLNLI